MKRVLPPLNALRAFAAGRLVAPFDGPRLPSRSYCTYVADAKAGDELVVMFRSWLEREGMCS
ncbi:hypothetical protein B0G57_10315 [Trinickia symbiotica]|nr:hypothetical protein B0G57_10315 [Trinickia symbiotica]